MVTIFDRDKGDKRRSNVRWKTGKKHALNHLKPYIFGASVLKKDDCEIREMELFADRLTRHPCFVG